MKRKNLFLRKERTMGKYSKVFIIVIAFFLVLFYCGNPAFSQKSPKDKFVFPSLNPIQMPKVEKVELANGLTLFLVEDHQYPTIDLRAMVRTGSVFEPPSKVGLAAICGQVEQHR